MCLQSERNETFEKDQGSEQLNMSLREERKSISRSESSLSEQIFKQEVNNMRIILEHYKLEIITLLPKVLEIISKALSKKKKSAVVEKARSQSKIQKFQQAICLVMKTVNKVRLSVIQEHGSLVNCTNDRDFNDKLEQLMISKPLMILNSQINDAIDRALNGEDPGLEVILDDEKLNNDSYKQIVTKIYAVIRFSLYQTIKTRSQEINGNLQDIELKEIVRNLDIDSIRKQVFGIFEISFGLDAQLSLRKIQYLHQDDEMFQNYLKCLKEAHDRFLGYIFQGYKFKKMEQNPLHSKDLNYGVPNLFNQILDELLDDTHQIMAEEFQMQQIKKFNNNVSPRAKLPAHRNPFFSNLSRRSSNMVSNDQQSQLEDNQDEMIKLTSPINQANYRTNSNTSSTARRFLFLNNAYDEEDDNNNYYQENSAKNNSSQKMTPKISQQTPSRTNRSNANVPSRFIFSDSFIKISPNAAGGSSKTLKIIANEKNNHLRNIDIDDDEEDDDIGQNEVRFELQEQESIGDSDDEGTGYVKPMSL